MLASIQKILDVKKHPNADNLDLVKVLGWQVVTKRNEFKVGDLVVYVEIDTIVPEKPETEFLRNKNFRIKTIKLRGEMSQGIVFPASIVPPHFEGMDVTEVLGIKHYEKPIPQSMKGVIRGNFPGFVPKTDEVRVQSVPDILCEIQGVSCYVTVKMDGSSATFLNKDGDYQVCSRNMSYKLDDENKGNVFVAISNKYGLQDKLKAIGNYAIQGEVCGPGIQKNRMCLKEHELFVFNIFDIDNVRYVSLNKMGEIINKLGLKMVPLVETITFDKKFIRSIDDLLEMSKGCYSGTKNRREGIVIRSIEERYSRVLKGRMSFKVVNNDYLLKDEE